MSEKWIALFELRQGALFETANGIRAVKSEYCTNEGRILCVLLASGEYASFNQDRVAHNSTLVRELELPSNDTPSDKRRLQAIAQELGMSLKDES